MFSTIADPDDNDADENGNINKLSLNSCNQENSQEGVRFRDSNLQNHTNSNINASNLDADQDPIAQFRRKQLQA